VPRGQVRALDLQGLPLSEIREATFGPAAAQDGDGEGAGEDEVAGELARLQRARGEGRGA
jgi:hypothetical protein